MQAINIKHITANVMEVNGKVVRYSKAGKEIGTHIYHWFTDYGKRVRCFETFNEVLYGSGAIVTISK